MGLQGGREGRVCRKEESVMVGSREETAVMRPGGASDGRMGFESFNFISSASVWSL